MAVVKWSKGFRVYRYSDNNIVAVSPNEIYFFSEEKFPLFHLIDGRRDIDCIIENCGDSRVGGLFYYNYMRVNKSTSLFFECEDFLSISKAPDLIPVVDCLVDFYRKNFHAKIIIADPSFSSAVNALKREKSRVVSCFSYMTFIEGDIVLSPVFDSEKDFLSYLSSFSDVRPWFGWDVEEILSNNDDACFSQEDIDDFSLISNYKIAHFLSANLKKLPFSNLVIRRSGEVDLFRCFDRGEIFLNSDNGCCSNVELPGVIVSRDGGLRVKSPEDTLLLIEDYINPYVGPLLDVIDYPYQRVGFTGCISSFVKIGREINFNDYISDGTAQFCYGKGMFDAQAKVSGLCEAIERFSAQFSGMEYLHKAKATDLSGSYYTFKDFFQYSDRQYIDFSNPLSKYSARNINLVKYDNEEINWVELLSLTYGNGVLVPASICYSGYDFDDKLFGYWNSNGAAAGNTFQEAILQAILEIIERDAVAIWWYNKVPSPSFDISNVNQEFIEHFNSVLADEFQFWVLDLTIDTKVPVMVAIAQNVSNGQFLFGFGCHTQAEIAAERALTELCQIIPLDDPGNDDFDFKNIASESFLYPSFDRYSTYCSSDSNGLPVDLKKVVDTVVENIHELGFEILVLDYKRNLPVSTVKVFIPGMCHIWPELGNSRLYDVPLKLGNIHKKLDESEVNQINLYL